MTPKNISTSVISSCNGLHDRKHCFGNLFGKHFSADGTCLHCVCSCGHRHLVVSTWYCNVGPALWLSSFLQVLMRHRPSWTSVALASVRKDPFRSDPIFPFPMLHESQESKRHINLRKLSGHRPGVPGTPGGTNRGLPAGVPGTSCCLL